MTNLWLTIGLPGSGKSYFINNEFANLINKNKSNISIISRDQIRFTVLDKYNTNIYFSHEDEVFETFTNLIVESIRDPNITDVVADATHLTPNSRTKIIKAIQNYTKDFNICFITAFTNFEICQERNEKRKGREHVPIDVMIDMAKKIKFPREEELEKYNVMHKIIIDEHNAAYYQREE